MSDSATKPLLSTPQGLNASRWEELDRLIHAYELGRSSGKSIHEFLPDPFSPDRKKILIELIRIDLELSWDDGKPKLLEDYQPDFPELFDDVEAIKLIAFEEYRCSIRAGRERPSDYYLKRFGLDTSLWKATITGSSALSAGQQPHNNLSMIYPTIPVLEEITKAFPEFEIVRQLGEGTFANVVLARQFSMSHRYVVLKVTRQDAGQFQSLGLEVSTLAQLQHTNIVPVYSVHCSNGLQAIVMPYFGSHTLADELRQPSKPLPTHQALEIALCISDALIHSHQLDILHLDLKPANILLPEGRLPMLLDFNLSARKSANSASIGGTLAYLEPEQLTSEPSAAATVQTDIYALGLILLEMLNGKYPWPKHDGKAQNLLEIMRAERLSVSQVILALSDKISPSVRSILTKCLQADRSSRYGTAEELHDDLKREIISQPLKHAPDRNIKNRIQKFFRRNPGLRSTSFVLICCMCMLLLGAFAYRAQQNAARDIAFRHAVAEFEASRHQLRMVLASPSPHPVSVNRALAAGHNHFDKLFLGLSEMADQKKAISRVADLSPHLLEQIPELILLMSRGSQYIAQKNTQITTPSQIDYAHLARLFVKSAQTETVSLNSPLDYYLAGVESAGKQDMSAAVEYLEKSLELEPTDPAASLLLGQSLFVLGKTHEAITRVRIATALDPRSAYLWHELGRMYFETAQWPLSLSSYTKAAELDDGFSSTFTDMAIVHLNLGSPEAAQLSLNRAKELDPNHTRHYFIQSAIDKKLGKHSEAFKEFQLGLTAHPTDEQSFISRGVAKLQSNIDEAVGDFHSALKLNPLSYTSLQNLAYVYSELKQDLPSAIESLKHLHSLRPYHAETLTALAVLYARSGHDELAVDSVAKALEANPSAPAFFQAACAHAIMSTRNDKSLEQSFALLSRALAGGFGHDLLESDVDLKYIRHHSEFDALLQFSRLHVK